MNILESTGPITVVELVSVSLHIYKTEKSSTIFVGKVLFKIFVSQVPILINSARQPALLLPFPCRGRGREGKGKRPAAPLRPL